MQQHTAINLAKLLNILDKCHQKNALTFWPFKFNFHCEKNKMRMSYSRLSTFIHWFCGSPANWACQVSDLLKRRTTTLGLHTNRRRQHQNISAQLNPKYTSSLFWLWKNVFYTETQWEWLCKSTSGALLPLIVLKCVACHFNRWQAWESHVITECAENDHMAVLLVHYSVLFDIGLSCGA